MNLSDRYALITSINQSIHGNLVFNQSESLCVRLGNKGTVFQSLASIPTISLCTVLLICCLLMASHGSFVGPVRLTKQGKKVGKLSKCGSLSEIVRCLFNVPAASRAPDTDVSTDPGTVKCERLISCRTC